jgi:hypothetical protein
MKNSLAGSPWLFSDGLAAVLIKNKWGYIDRQGHVAIAPQYTAASGFSEGLAAVEVNNKYGFIDRYGKMVIKPKYDFALAFTEGVAACSIGDGFHIIDRNGRVLAELGEDCTDVENFSCGLAAAEFEVGDDDWRYGAIDKTGKMVIQPKYWFAYTFEEDLMAVVLNEEDKFGFVDKEGNFAIAPEYEDAEIFSEGLAPVKKDGRWRFIDHDGHDVVLLDERFDYVNTLTDGRAMVKIGDKSGAIDKAGNLIIDARFDNMHPFSEGLAYARIGDTHGFINPSGIFEIQKPVTKATLIDKLMKRGNWLRW